MKLRVASNLIFVSGDSCVEDFCWYWSVRAQRYWREPILPLWLPENLIRERMNDLRHLFPRNKGYLLSKSLDGQTLQDIASEFGHDVIPVQFDFDRFYAHELLWGIENRQEVIFANNRTRVSNIQPDEVKNTTPPALYYVDIDIPNYVLPKQNTGVWGDMLLYNYRVIKSGLSYCSYYLNGDYIELTLPTPWQMLQTYAHHAGYDVVLSDKGELAEKLVDLIGGVHNIWILSGTNVYKLIGKLAEIAQSHEFRRRLSDIWCSIGSVKTNKSDFENSVLQLLSRDRHDRALLDYGQMKSILQMEHDLEKRFINWLIVRRVIFRGLLIECPVCKTKLRYSPLSRPLHG